MKRVLVVLVVVFILTGCMSMMDYTPVDDTYVPPPTSHKITYERAHPRVFDLSHIRKVAILSFGNDVFTDELAERIIGHSN